MNRTIKFRVWNTLEEEWMQYPNQEDFIPGDEDFNQMFDNESVVFQQFTGLFDKKGKEIYEGDILEYGKAGYDTKYVVEFNDRTGSFTASGLPFNMNTGRYVDSRTMVVVGNVFGKK